MKIRKLGTKKNEIIKFENYLNKTGKLISTLAFKFFKNKEK